MWLWGYGAVRPRIRDSCRVFVCFEVARLHSQATKWPLIASQPGREATGHSPIARPRSDAVPIRPFDSDTDTDSDSEPVCTVRLTVTIFPMSLEPSPASEEFGGRLAALSERSSSIPSRYPITVRRRGLAAPRKTEAKRRFCCYSCSTQRLMDTVSASRGLHL